MDVNEEVSMMIDSLVTDSIGAALTKAREKKGVTVREAAEALKIMPYQVTALEAEDFSSFKASVFARSYLQNYCKYLSIDSEPYLDLYQQHHHAERETNYIEPPKPIQHASNRRYWGIAAAIFVLVFLWWWNGSTPSDPVTQNTEEQLESLSDALTVIAIEENAGNNLSAVDDTVTPSSEMAPQDTNLAAAIDDPRVENIIQEALNDATPEQLVNTSIDKIQLQFSEDCWVQIKDRQGKTLVADLKRKGENLMLEGEAPFKILLGNAPGVSLVFNGETVALQANKQMIRLTLGES